MTFSVMMSSMLMVWPSSTIVTPYMDSVEAAPYSLAKVTVTLKGGISSVMKLPLLLVSSADANLRIM